MDKVKELGRELLLPEYEERFKLLCRIFHRLLEWQEFGLALIIAKKAAGVKMMIDYLKEE